MKIYFLRHELRPLGDPTFLIELTDKGKNNAQNKLIIELNKLNITRVFCSPFLRTLQTIGKFCSENNLEINIEYSICETIQDPKFENNDNLYLDSSLDIYNSYNINNNYISLINCDQIKYPESIEDIKTRSRTLLQYLYSNHQFRDDNILICTHQGIVNNLINFYGLKREMNEPYEMGQISTVRKGNQLILIN